MNKRTLHRIIKYYLIVKIYLETFTDLMFRLVSTAIHTAK